MTISPGKVPRRSRSMPKKPQGCTSTMPAAGRALRPPIGSRAARACCRRRALDASMAGLSPRLSRCGFGRAQAHALEGGRGVARILDPAEAAPAQARLQPRLRYLEERPAINSRRPPSDSLSGRGRRSHAASPSRPLPRANRMSSVSAWSSRGMGGEDHADAMCAGVCCHQAVAGRPGGRLQAGARLVALPDVAWRGETRGRRPARPPHAPRPPLRPQAVIDGDYGKGVATIGPCRPATRPATPSAPSVAAAGHSQRNAVEAWKERRTADPARGPDQFAISSMAAQRHHRLSMIEKFAGVRGTVLSEFLGRITSQLRVLCPL